MALGAILTQNTSWQNVEKAITNLKAARVLSFGRLSRLKEKEIARLIRSAGYYNIKARRIRNFLSFLETRYSGRIERMRCLDAKVARHELLEVNGIGPETADSILLYALGKPVFVIDAYTRRIFSRHGFKKEARAYETLQQLFTQHLACDARLFNEYHALLVKCGKDFCKKNRRRCAECPINEKK
jgi:endonuclease-3 related protein